MTEIANVFIVNLLASTRHFCIQFKGILPPFSNSVILFGQWGFFLQMSFRF